jgi:hypothetical protein
MSFAPYSATVLQLAPEAPTLSARPAAGGSVQVQLQGQAGTRYVLEASANWASWTPVWTNTLVGSSAVYTNTATTSAQFWRARWQP